MLKRAVFFVYGIVCYQICFATLLYAIGFIGHFAVPTTLDGAASEPLGTAAAIDVSLLALFALQHSAMARRRLEDWCTRVVPRPIERSTHVLLASLSLIAMFWCWRPLGGEVWMVEGATGRLVLNVLFGAGWALVLLSTFVINHFDLFGLRQVWLHLLGRPYVALRFATPARYRMVRHPLHAGWLLVFWMTPAMTVAHLLLAVATTSYILLEIQFEERDLVREHGASHEQRRVAYMPEPGRVF